MAWTVIVLLTCGRRQFIYCYYSDYWTIYWLTIWHSWQFIHLLFVLLLIPFFPIYCCCWTMTDCCYYWFPALLLLIPIGFPAWPWRLFYYVWLLPSWFITCCCCYSQTLLTNDNLLVKTPLPTQTVGWLFPDCWWTLLYLPCYQANLPNGPIIPVIPRPSYCSGRTWLIFAWTGHYSLYLIGDYYLFVLIFCCPVVDYLVGGYDCCYNLYLPLFIDSLLGPHYLFSYYLLYSETLDPCFNSHCLGHYRHCCCCWAWEDLTDIVPWTGLVTVDGLVGHWWTLLLFVVEPHYLFCPCDPQTHYPIPTFKGCDPAPTIVVYSRCGPDGQFVVVAQCPVLLYSGPHRHFSASRTQTGVVLTPTPQLPTTVVGDIDQCPSSIADYSNSQLTW